jgi:tetratricopeptide (TPR) repeat protein
LQQEIEGLSDELALKPSHATVLFILGLLWSRKNDSQNALKFLRAALDISNTTGDVKLQGRCLEAMAAEEAGLGNASEAISLYKQAIPLSSKPGLVWKNVGLLLSNTREHQQTMDAFLNALRTSPQDLASWIHLGDAYLDLGLLEKAGSAFETALELSPASDLAWTGLGQTRLQVGETDRAVTAFQEAVRSNPQNVSAWVGLGQCYLDQRKEADAMSAYQKAAEIDPGNAGAWNQLGLLYMGQKRYDRAMDVLHKVNELQPESGEVCKNLGIAEYHCGNFSRAAYHFEQAIPLFDDRSTRAFLWKCLAETCRKLKNEPMAVSALKQAAKLAQPLPSPVPKEPLPDAAEQERSPQEIGGSSMIESTQTFESRSAKDWSDLGHSFLKAGAYKKAVFAYTKAIELAPENSWPYIKNLAVANYQMGKRLGKRLSDQAEDPELLEAEEEEQEISFSVADNLPQPQRSDDSSLSSPQDPGPAPDPGPAISLPLPVISTETVVTSQEASPSAEDWNEWGNNYAATGDFEKAIESYKKSIQANPNYGQPYSNLGFLYFKKGDYRLAAILYQKGIELLPAVDDKAATLNRLGDTLHRLHKYEDAFIAYKKARELAPSANPILDRARISILQNSIS